MTPQEIFEYKFTWLKNAHIVTIDEYLDLEGKRWCRENIQKHKWSFSKYTGVYEHSFYFEEGNTAEAFEEWLRSH
jgi:hypothetical protein